MSVAAALTGVNPDESKLAITYDVNTTLRAMMAVGQMCVMIAVGAGAAHAGFVPKRNMKVISGLVTGVFTPALLFSNLSAGADATLIGKSLVLPLVALSCCACGLLVGYAARRSFLRKTLAQGRLSKIFQAACVIGNSQGLPLVLTSALVSPSQWTECVKYISLYIVNTHLVTWLGVYNWLKSEIDDARHSDSEGEDAAPLLSPSREADPHYGASPSLASDTSHHPALFPMSPFPQCSTPKLFVEKVYAALNPPLIAVILGLTCGLVQPIHHNFARPGAPLKWVHDSIARVAGAAVPLVMTLMGASMYYSVFEHRASKLPGAALVTLAVIRLMIVPCVGVLFVALFGKLLDPMLCLVILVEACTPTANNVTVILSRLGIDPVPIGNAYLFQYLCAIPIYSVYLSFALDLSGAAATPPDNTTALR
eukprot:TRINITY_DN15814_c0_g2_i1.p1 TRINITY_DN15814_c0_g2~~TRINITY_DN15814_c0_g2_i1.p1  ORF type:complete len:443 (+),score=131.28 TRINITY_DN15814_c0_g2_i1:58-1329(+)